MSPLLASPCANSWRANPPPAGRAEPRRAEIRPWMCEWQVPLSLCRFALRTSAMQPNQHTTPWAMVDGKPSCHAVGGSGVVVIILVIPTIMVIILLMVDIPTNGCNMKGVSSGVLSYWRDWARGRLGCCIVSPRELHIWYREPTLTTLRTNKSSARCSSLACRCRRCACSSKCSPLGTSKKLPAQMLRTTAFVSQGKSIVSWNQVTPTNTC